MDHFFYPVISTLVFLLCQFATFAYYLINYLIFDTKYSALVILLHMIKFYFTVAVNDDNI